jgi:hypothetical protein
VWAARDTGQICELPGITARRRIDSRLELDVAWWRINPLPRKVQELLWHLEGLGLSAVRSVSADGEDFLRDLVELSNASTSAPPGQGSGLQGPSPMAWYFRMAFYLCGDRPLDWTRI